MAGVNKYKIWCVTEDAWVSVWAEEEPINCPNNTSHAIDQNSISVEETLSAQDVNIKSQGLHLKTETHGFRDLTGFNVFRKGYKFVVTAGDTYEHDINYDSDMMLQGLGYKLDGDVREDDYLEVEIVDVDGVVYPAGTVLAKFSETVYVIPNEISEVLCDDAKLIYNWMYIRTRYVSNGTQNPVAVRITHILRTISA